jgi:hypothetical protein
MATKTRAEMVDWTLEVLGVKPAGQSASAEDADLVGRYFDTTYASLRKLGVAPFGTSAVPEWAQASFAHIVAADMTNHYGITGERLADLKSAAAKGRRDLTEQCANGIEQTPVVPNWF